ncbi:ribonuclease H-like domain-containing protein, partial [Tanacetum coccineum]
MNQFCEMKGIKREFSVARTLQQIRVAEWKNITLIEATRTMLADLKLPTTFWAEVVNTACYVQNRVLVIKPHNKTPYELFLGRKPTLSFMRPFGCPVTILNTIDHLGKARVETIPGKYYILLPLWTQDPPFFSNPKDSPDAGFKPSGEEEKKDAKDPGNESGNLSEEGKRVDQEKDANVNIYGCADDPNIPDLEEIGRFSDGAEADMTNLDTHIPVSLIPTTKIHKDHPVEQIIADIHSAPQTRRMTKSVTEHAVFKEPKKVIHALKDLSWIKAMQELQQFKLQKVWTLVDLPNDKMAIGTKWVFRNKKDERGIVIKNKARLVTQGYTQEEGINYDVVFSPVAKIEAIRLFLAYASYKDFVVYQMDVKSAFLYGSIKEEVYVCESPGFEDPDFLDRVYKVEKALYGLHQALIA